MRRATCLSKSSSSTPLFQSTLSMRRATIEAAQLARDYKAFQSTLSMRRATRFAPRQPFISEFQSTLSMRRATLFCRIVASGWLISIHALHEESDKRERVPHRYRNISIHALHEESDRQGHHQQQQRKISIHALHEESDPLTYASCICQKVFQSTLSMRRATSTRSGLIVSGDIISIHALHEESDQQLIAEGWVQRPFQSTLSMRRATSPVRRALERGDISIHALHEESDRELVR